MSRFDSKDAKIEGLSLYGWIVSGLLVGIGTKAGNGCTSGHGVCGIPRFSPRSLAAVMTFMATCAFTATYRKNSPFWEEEYTFTSEFDDTYRWALVLVANGLLISFFAIYLITLVMDKESMMPLIETPVSIIIGGIFAFGLCLSGMTRRTKVYNFFTISPDWDPSLGFVMGGAILVNVITFTYIIKHRGRPFFVRKLGPLANGFPDLKLFFGAGVFGIGWGICGLCPGPAMLNSVHLTHCLIWLPAVGAGQLLWEGLEKIYSSIFAKDSKTKQKRD